MQRVRTLRPRATWLTAAALALFACAGNAVRARPTTAVGAGAGPAPSASDPGASSSAEPPVSGDAASSGPSSTEPSSTDDDANAPASDEDDLNGGEPACDDVPFGARRTLAVSEHCSATVRQATQHVVAPIAETWKDLVEIRDALEPPECAKPAAPRTETEARKYVCRPPCTAASSSGGGDQCPAGKPFWTIATQRKDGALTGIFVQPIREWGLFYREIVKYRDILNVSARIEDGYVVVDESGEGPSGCETNRTIYYPLCDEAPLTVSLRDPRVRVRVRAGRATFSGPGCNDSVLLDEGVHPLVVWDPRAHDCRTNPGEPGGGWMGCSRQCTDPNALPPTGVKCLTGSHWVCCDGCYCDKGKYDPGTHTCR